MILVKDLLLRLYIPVFDDSNYFVSFDLIRLKTIEMFEVITNFF